MLIWSLLQIWNVGIREVRQCIQKSQGELLGGQGNDRPVFKPLLHSFLVVGSWTIGKFLLNLEFFTCKIVRQCNNGLMELLYVKHVLGWWLD